MQEYYYNPTLQTKFDEHGNCLSAVIATLLNVGIDDVPMFADNGDTWAQELNNWLAAKFCKYAIPVNLSEKEHIDLFCGSYVITAIDSENPRVDRHAVISRDGRIVFDPMVGEINKDLEESMHPTFFILGDIITK